MSLVICLMCASCQLSPGDTQYGHCTHTGHRILLHKPRACNWEFIPRRWGINYRYRHFDWYKNGEPIPEEFLKKKDIYM